jgi:hypothetical protein
MSARNGDRARSDRRRKARIQRRIRMRALLAAPKAPKEKKAKPASA